MDCFQDFFFCLKMMLLCAFLDTFPGAHNFGGCGSEFLE